MSLLDVLIEINPYLNGRVIYSSEVNDLARNFPLFQLSWLTDILLVVPITGCEFHLENPLVNMRWMTPQEMISEATEFYPGIAAIKAGYFPVGDCLFGSGDPYFIQVSTIDSKLFRIPHDSVDSNGFVIEYCIDIISQTLSDFFKQARM
jgi:hypothetical protein